MERRHGPPTTRGQSPLNWRKRPSHEKGEKPRRDEKLVSKQVPESKGDDSKHVPNPVKLGKFSKQLPNLIEVYSEETTPEQKGHFLEEISLAPRQRTPLKIIGSPTMILKLRAQASD